MYIEEKIQCKKLFLQGIPIREIAKTTGIGYRTIYRWKSIENWDKEYEKLQLGNIGISVTLKNAAIKVIKRLEQATEETGGKEEVARIADTLAKLSKIMDRFDPQKVIFADLMHLFNVLVEFAEMKSDSDFLSKLQTYIPEISNYILHKFDVD